MGDIVGNLAYPKIFPADLCNAFLTRFNLCFISWILEQGALKAFSQTSISKLVGSGIPYPTNPPTSFIRGVDQDDILKILKRIDVLCNLEGFYLEVYAIIPYIFTEIEAKDLKRLAKPSTTRFRDVKATENDCALLGVILLLLTGEVPVELYSLLYEELKRLFYQGIDILVWHSYSRRFSLSGVLMAYKAGIEVYKETDKENLFRRCSRYDILHNLEALPPERDKLPDVPI